VSRIPAPLAPFVGRKREMAILRRLFPHTRVLTLVGAGGAGKTRLALEFARQQEPRFPDGVILVDLSSVQDPELVVDAVCRPAGLAIGSDPLTTLQRRLASSRALLLMDNCEHVVEATAALIASLLPACPRLLVLATSRQRLNIQGETIWRVPAMGLPVEGATTEMVGSADAVRLFVERARKVRAGFSLEATNATAVAGICHRLDGLPLAIELAVVWMTVLSPADILSRLDDRFRFLRGGNRTAPRRHQTLGAAVDWSYELLDPREQTLLQRLSIFAGDFTVEAAEEICTMPKAGAHDVVEGLSRLADRSMLQVQPDDTGTMRYRLLETIREYAAARLPDDETATLRDRHLSFYLRLAESAFRQSLSDGAVAPHRRLWHEIADVRAALAWSRKDPEQHLTLATNLIRLWMRFSPAEGLRHLDDALSRAPADASWQRVMGLWAWGGLLIRAGTRGRLHTSMEEFGRMVRELGDGFLIANIHLGLAYQAEHRHHDLETARAHLQEATAIFEGLQDWPDLSLATGSLGNVEMQLGHPEVARPLIRRALEIALAADDPYNAAGANFHLGWLALDHGAREDAIGHFRAALDLADPRDVLSIAFQLEGIASAEAERDPTYALTLFGAGSRMRVEVDTPLGPSWPSWADRVTRGIEQARARLTVDRAEGAWTAGKAMPAIQAVAEVRRRLTAAAAGKASLPGGLSKRELEIARLVATGMTNRAIAEKLFLAERTVESHLDHIMAKLDLNTRTQVASWLARKAFEEAPVTTRK